MPADTLAQTLNKTNNVKEESTPCAPLVKYQRHNLKRMPTIWKILKPAARIRTLALLKDEFLTGWDACDWQQAASSGRSSTARAFVFVGSSILNPVVVVLPAAATARDWRPPQLMQRYIHSARHAALHYTVRDIDCNSPPCSSVCTAAAAAVVVFTSLREIVP